MKSIVKKLRYCLTLLVLGLFSFNASYAQETPTDAELNQLLTSRDAKTLEEYLIAKGYKNVGSIQGSSAAATITLTDADGNQLDSKARSVVTANTFKNAAGNVVEVTYAADLVDGAGRLEASGDDPINSYNVVNGSVQVTPRDAEFARLSFAQKVDNCWRQHGGGIISNCVSCYNCVKNAVSGGGSTWAKIVRALRCVGSCYRCLSGIVSFVYCVVR